MELGAVAVWWAVTLGLGAAALPLAALVFLLGLVWFARRR